MQVKSSLHVVEEMTSLSRIIRSTNAQPPAEEAVVEIKLQNFFEPVHYGETEEELDDTPQLTIEDIQQERQVMLQQMNNEIEQQRRKIEEYQNEQLAFIDTQKQAWEEEKLLLQQNAYEEGFAQGYEEGVQKVNATMAQSIQIANNTMKDAEENASKYIESQEEIILDLALTAAERIIGASLDRQDELYVSIIKRGLKEAREMKEVKLYVAPKYHELVTKHHSELTEMFPINVLFMIFVNEDFVDTESYIETNHGRIIISIDEQLQELRRQLYELIESKE
jgi:flagellar assembly protein FliH